jgi:hypothetical protein
MVEVAKPFHGRALSRTCVVARAGRGGGGGADALGEGGSYAYFWIISGVVGLFWTGLYIFAGLIPSPLRMCARSSTASQSLRGCGGVGETAEREGGGGAVLNGGKEWTEWWERVECSGRMCHIIMAQPLLSESDSHPRPRQHI